MSSEQPAEEHLSVEQKWQRVREDPLELEALLCRETTVHCEGGRCYTGIVQAIDPVTKSIILADVDTNGKVTKLVMCIGSSIVGVLAADKRSEHAAVVDAIFRPQNEKQLSSKELSALRDNLLSYLKSHQLPVSIDAQDGKTLRISHIAHIAPPYSVKEVYCQNEIVMERITKLLNEMPSAVEDVSIKES